jgi:quercetin dioxygenase-like cupin family protein
MDFRISRYAPNAYVQAHTHKIQEQVYYVLEGEGLLTLGKGKHPRNVEKHLMRPHDYVYVPPGVPHSFTNTGLAGLVFLVITTPADDEPNPKGGK